MLNADTDSVCGNKRPPHQTSVPNKRIAIACINAFKTIFTFWSQTEKLGIFSVLSQTWSLKKSQFLIGVSLVPAETYHPLAVVVRIWGQSVVPRLRGGWKRRQRGVVGGTTVSVAGQHHIPKLLLLLLHLDAALLHLDVARAVRDWERDGGSKLEGQRPAAAGFSWGDRGRRSHMATCRDSV